MVRDKRSVGKRSEKPFGKFIGWEKPFTHEEMMAARQQVTRHGKFIGADVFTQMRKNRNAKKEVTA